MNCQDARQLLSVSLDAEIDAVQNQRLRRHLHECSECERYAADLTRLGRTLNEWEAPHPTAGFAPRVSSALRRDDVERSWLREWIEALRPVAAAAAMVALVCGIALAAAMNGHAGAPGSGSDDPVDVAYTESFELVPGDSVGGGYLALLEEPEE